MEIREIPQLDTGAQLTCREVVATLDRHIIGQHEAKRAVAIALRNRWRRMRLPESVRKEVVPNNIVLIGPTGVGKTEIARRLAQIGGLPFLKVEATKFTEKGYVGRDVDSMVRDLAENAVNLVRSQKERAVREEIDAAVEERLLDLLFPPLRTEADDPERRQRWERSRAKVRDQLRQGVLEDRRVTLTSQQSKVPVANIFTSAGMDVDPGFEESLKSMFPKKTIEKELTVAQARKQLREEEVSRRLDDDQLAQEALDLTEQGGIIFIDEIDKIAGKGTGGGGSGPDISREGVQRDLLPIVEGTTVSTKYGMVATDHILFVAAGAFHMSKPSDLIPELQGRFPVRVELSSLSEEDFVRILRDTDSSLLKQYQAILDVDQCQLTFTEDSVHELARTATELNKRLENIGARRLQTILAQLLDDLLFEVPHAKTGPFEVTAEFVRQTLAPIVRDEDLTRYIL